MNTAVPQPVLDTPGQEIPLDLPSLCTPLAQVLDFDCNNFQRMALYKQETVRWLANNSFWKEAYKVEHCGESFIHLKCNLGHEKYVRLYCKCEFCPTCGDDGSREHKKRTARARDRLTWAPIIGYLIFTLPGTVSENRPSVQTLKDMQKEANDILKRNFNAPGSMSRYHLMGKAVGKLHIHLNILFPLLGTNGLGKVAPEKLEKIRKEWTFVVNKYFGLSLKNTDIFYSFAATDKKKYHKIKYVLRPITGTFEFYTLSNEDKKYILSLRGWHNTRWFGKLSNNSYKKYLLSKGIDPARHQDEDPYLSHVCPVCEGRYRYQGIVSQKDLPRGRLRWLENDILIDLETYAYLKEHIDDNAQEG